MQTMIPDYTLRQRRDCLRDLAAYLGELVRGISPDERADEEADSPSLAVTIGFTFDERIRWGAQTGDNSFTGAAYSHPHWAVLTLTPDSNPWQCALDALEEAEELACQ